MNRLITREHTGSDLMFTAWADGDVVGQFYTWIEADKALDAVCDASFDPSETGPSTDEPGGPGGTPPPDDTTPCRTTGALVSADPAAQERASFEDGPYFANAARGHLFYVNPRFGCIARGTFHRSRVARIAATLNAMRWPDA